MFLTGLLIALPFFTFAQSQETVIGVYIFHRHGDRTAKATPPSNLTDLGYSEVFERGQYYRNRYIASNASNRISGINADVVRQAQIAVSAPVDNVLQNSAAGFLQGLYPPAGDAAVQTLRNGSSVQSPMGGFQLVPVNIVDQGSGSEDAGFLQDASTCSNAKISSSNYFKSAQYLSLQSSTMDFYQRILPTINGSFNASTDTFQNAYTIFDLINVAEIHNQTITSSNLLNSSTLFQLRTLADTHEWGLAYNATDDMRAVAGKQLAGQIVDYLNSSISSFAQRNNKLGIQFGAYGTFFSLFGLTNLTSASPNFFGVPDYASSMVFELFTTADVSGGAAPSADQLSVRFLFHNGTSDNSTDPTAFPLFAQKSETLSWPDFVGNMSSVSISSTQEWCTQCGNFTGMCAGIAPTLGGGNGSGGGGGSHISTAVGGVIGAIVTLVVILGLEALIMLLGGLRLVSKRKLAGTNNGAASPTVKA